MMALEGRVALVTGGGRGIGRALALALGRAGAHVAVGYRERRAEAEAVAAEVGRAGRRACVVGGDVASERDVTRMVAEVRAVLGEIEVLAANAGLGPVAGLDDLDLATFDRTIAVNLRSAFLLAQAVVPAMRRRRFGRLLFLSSTAAQVGGVVGPHYAASKAGLIGLMHGYASRLAAEGITANAIAPALVETDMIGAVPGVRPEALPVRRFGRPEEVAELAVAVIANGFVTGQTIQVNGGAYFT
jgi:3-oxoacyl-[acyl-carrier protein] reductase